MTKTNGSKISRAGGQVVAMPKPNCVVLQMVQLLFPSPRAGRGAWRRDLAPVGF